MSIQVFVVLGAIDVIRVVLVVIAHTERRVTSITPDRTFFKARTRVDARQSCIFALEITINFSMTLELTVFQFSTTVLDAFCVQ